MAIDPLLRTLIEDRDAECPVCGYTLKGLSSAVCPECGTELTLTVGTPDPRLGIWLVGLVLFALPTGFHFIVLMWAGTMAMGGLGPAASDFIPLTIGSFVGAGLVATMTRGRRAFRKRPRLSRVGVVVAGSVILYGTVAMFFVIVL
ncbi:MAG: hypothetical protein AAF235_00225 [Planctomycetota bacterium]